MYQSSMSFKNTATKTASTAVDTDYDLRPTGRGFHELKIRGQLPPRWLANLTSALAARGINIQRGNASKLTPSLWQATLDIAPAGDGELPVGLDYPALAQTTVAADPAAVPIHLDSYSLEMRSDSLFVEVKGADSVGFLVALLKTFAFFSLFPAEVHIDTPGGRVHDRFWLKGVGGLAPSESSRQGLQIELDKLCR
jgi:hypothetical protein